MLDAVRGADGHRERTPARGAATLTATNTWIANDLLAKPPYYRHLDLTLDFAEQTWIQE